MVIGEGFIDDQEDDAGQEGQSQDDENGHLEEGQKARGEPPRQLMAEPRTVEPMSQLVREWSQSLAGHQRWRAPVRFRGAPRWCQSTAEAALVGLVECDSAGCLLAAVTARRSVEDDAGHHRVTKKKHPR